jgi:hypothetical protein
MKNCNNDNVARKKTLCMDSFTQSIFESLHMKGQCSCICFVIPFLAPCNHQCQYWKFCVKSLFNNDCKQNMNDDSKQ